MGIKLKNGSCGPETRKLGGKIHSLKARQPGHEVENCKGTKRSGMLAISIDALQRAANSQAHEEISS